jgi:beta-galactosidase
MLSLYENPEVQSLYRLPARSNLLPFNSSEKASDYCARGPLATEFESEYVKSLDGKWDFMLYENPMQADSLDFEVLSQTQWQTITVPGTWTRQGYDKPHYTNVQMPFNLEPPFAPKKNPVGIYRLKVVIPKNWKDRRVVIHIGSAESCTSVIVNSQFVGLSKDTRLPCEFDITDFLLSETQGVDKEIQNEIIIKVIRYSDASYVEDQDQWWFGGIHRSVYLYSTENIYIEDIQALTYLKNFTTIPAKEIKTQLIGIVPLVITLGRLVNKNEKPIIKWQINKLSGSAYCGEVGNLIDKGELIGDYNYQKTSRQVRTEIAIKNPSLWSHETPSLYILTVSLFDNERHIESAACTIGFKDVRLENRELHINGKAVLIKGVNRHEHDEYTGKTLSTKKMLRDIELLKQYNFNAVRTCHYPNDERWYELCDRFGILLMDEANIENHAFYDQLSRSDLWTNAYMQRLQRMVRRDKNHASIFCWSLGNESGDGPNHCAMNGWLRRFDTTRLIQYEGAVRAEWTQSEFSLDTLARGKGLTDFISPMYPTIDLITEYAKKREDYRPIIMCEFSHAMGNSNGSLCDYWHAIEQTHGLQGGFIWDWIDQGLASTGTKNWKYGGDFGDTPTDYDFCLNGLLFPDQTPKPAMQECKKLFAPVKVSVLHVKQGVFEVTNCQDFTNLNLFKLTWQLLSNGKKIAAGTEKLAAVAPGKKVEVKIPYSEKLAKWYFECNAKLQNPGELVVHIDVVYQKDHLCCKKGSVCGWTECVVEKGFSDSFAAAFADQNTQVKLRPTAIPCETVNLVVAGSKPQLFRAPTENEYIKALRGQEENPLFDFYFANKPAPSWIDADIQHLGEENMQFSADKGQLVLQSDLYTGPNAKEHKLLGKFVRRVSSFVAPGKKAGTVWNIEFNLTQELSEYPRVGITAQLSSIFDKISWYGRGPQECYSDRCEGAALARYTSMVDELGVPYIVPQENGNRCDVRSLILYPKEGSKMSDGKPAVPLHIEGDVPFDFSYCKHTASDLWKQTHTCDLTDLSQCCDDANGIYILNIDIAQRGVGTGSCGPDTLEQYRVRPGVYHLQLRMW